MKNNLLTAINPYKIEHVCFLIPLNSLAWKWAHNYSFTGNNKYDQFFYINTLFRKKQTISGNLILKKK